MVRAKTLAVVVGISACTISWAVAGADRFVHRTIVALGFDDSQRAPTAQELLKKGVDDYRRGLYEEATQAFESASKLPGLSDKEQVLLAEYRALMVRVNKSRQEASDLLAAAHKSYEQGDVHQAESLASAVAANGYASEEIRDDAKAILAKVNAEADSQSSGKPSSEIASRREAQRLLANARQQLRQGNLDEAESLAQKAAAIKINYSRFEDSPSKALKDIADARSAGPRSSASAVTSNSKTKAKALVAEAHECLKRNELDRAEDLARQAKETKASFYLIETSPDDILVAVQKARSQRNSIARSKAPAAARASDESESVESKSTSSESAIASAEAQESPQTSTVHDQSQTEAEATDSAETRVATSHYSTGAGSGAAAATAVESAPPSVPDHKPYEVTTDAPDSAAASSDAQAKMEVRQLLAQARKMIDSGHLDTADELISRAAGYNVNWGRYENPVASMRRDLASARSRATSQNKPADANLSVASSPVDTRTQALELLRQGRAQLRAGNVAQAELLARRADQLKAKFRLLDDTPKQLLSECARVRDGAKTSSSDPSSGASELVISAEVAEIPTTRPAGKDKDVAKQAQVLLKKAREYLSNGDHDNAIEIARRVAAWNVDYGFFDDTPAKVENLAKTMKNRSVARASRSQTQRDRAVAESLVADARRDLERGDLDAAEAKARQAQELKVSVGMFSDHPASVLADINRARRAAGGQKIAPQPLHSAAQSTEVVPAEHAGGDPIRIETPASSRHTISSANAYSKEPPPEAIEYLAGVKSRPLQAPSRMVSQPGQSLLPQDSASVVQAGGESSTSSEIQLAEAIDRGSSTTLDSHQQRLDMARKLFEHGNYPRAREYASEVYSASAALRPAAEELIARISLAEQSVAYQLYEAGVAAMKKREYARALSFFQQVSASGAQLEPATDQQLRSYLRDLPARVGTPRTTAGVATVTDGSVQQQTDDTSHDQPNDLGQHERAKFQQLVSETNQKVQAAKLLLATDPAQAVKDLELAQESVRQSGLDPSMTEPLVRRLDTAIRYASQEKQRIDFDRLQTAATTATRAQRERQVKAELAKQQELVQLIEKGQVLLKEGRYADAEVEAKRALEVDPDNQAAQALLYKSKIEGQLAIQRELRDLKEERNLETWESVDRSAISFGRDDLYSVRYPDARKWEDLTESRKRRFEEIENRSRSPKELEIERKLYEPISINFTETPLGDVVAFLHDATQVNVFLDKHALAVDGISSDKPITIKLENISLKSALKIILDQMDLDYMIQNEALLITTPLKKQGKSYTRSYPVGDLVVPISAFPGQNLAGAVRNAGGAVGVGTGRPNMTPSGLPMPNAALAQFGTGLGGSPALSSQAGPLPGYSSSSGIVGTPPDGVGTGQIVDFDSLVELIEQTISPNSWSSVGGAGTIESFAPNLSLVVNQTQAVHDQISDLLTQLRRLQDLQVTVEVKFITLTEDFFERIGIDFDMDIQSDAQAPLRSFGQVLVPPTLGGGGGGGAGQQQTPAVLNLIYNDHDDDVAVGVGGDRDVRGINPGSGLPVFTPDLKIPFRTGGFGAGRPRDYVAGTGLNFGIAFLSDIEVFLFLEAAQQNNRGNVLTAPKVTLFNGSFALVFSGTIEPFVTALNPVVAAGAVAFDPQITQFFNGAFLGVQAVISADRRYVRLSLFPSFTNISGEKRFTVTGGAGGGGFPGGGGGAANAQAEIVVPIIAANFVFTTVSVPDGGTVMMGGLKSKQEFRNEFGTPILNKIPYVQRLFMNTGVQTNTRSLLLMVTPRIIIQEEEEELLGKTIAF